MVLSVVVVLMWVNRNVVIGGVLSLVVMMSGAGIGGGANVGKWVMSDGIGSGARR